ncbi:bifunctional diguanylate cyclase/phosphodiesterase [Qipengyuania marisflavi]|nr:EAL domain-containing protein [Qipengyuania marisflavi]
MAQQRHQHALDKLFLWTAAIFVVASIAAVVAIQLYSSYEIDRDYRERREKVVGNGIVNYARTLSEKPFPQAYWDDAVRNLDNRFDPAWAREFIGVYFWQTERFDKIAILDRDDKLRFAMVGGQDADFSALAPLMTTAQPLIAEVRMAEEKRGPIPSLDELGGTRQFPRFDSDPPMDVGEDQQQKDWRKRTSYSRWSDKDQQALLPIAAESMSRIGDRIYVVSATLVQPDSDAMPLTDRSAIILLAKEIDDEVIAGIAARFLVDQPQLRLGDAEAEPGFAQARLFDKERNVIAAVEWRPNRPGDALVRKTAPALAIFALLLALAVWLVMRSGRRITLDLYASEARASHLAYNDKLTALPNRVALDDRFAAFRRTHQVNGVPFAVLCIDIDNFKAVNDTYGHPVGDVLLTRVAASLRELVVEGDIIGRLGGDEFCILQADSNPKDAAELAQAIVDELSTPVDLEPGRVFVGASVGVVIVDADGLLDGPEAFRRADLAMYRAKELGRSQYTFFEPMLDEVARARQGLQSDLHQALAAGDLTLHYQPQVDADGAIIGAEALARWPAAEAKGISTATFVRAAEETGLIDALGQFTLARAFADTAAWPGLTVAINVSAAQVRASDFVGTIEHLVGEHNADPARFELEITEGLLMGQDTHTLDTLNRLRAMGFQIALDDFGTGYCGLSYLHLYPIDKVKIDISFVSRLGKEPQATALVDTIVRLAHALDLSVIAEGVETEDEKRLLMQVGCSLFQGYLTGRPMPPEELAKLL